MNLLNIWHGSTLLLQLVIITNLGFLFIIIILFISLLLHKSYTERRSRILERLKASYTQALVRRHFDSSYGVVMPVRPVEFEAAGSVIIHMLINVSGTMDASLRRFVRELKVDEYYKQQLNSSSWIKRYIALEKLGFFRFPEMKPLYRALLKDEPDVRVLSKAVWALSLIAERDDIYILNEVMKNSHFMSSKFTEFVYTNVIKAFRERDSEDEFVELLLELRDDIDIPLLLKRDILHACGEELLYSAKDVVISYFFRFHEMPEMKIACIRTIERLSSSDTNWLLLHCLGDDDWRVRNAAARDAHLCNSEVAETLRKTLYDLNYHVRINSAVSLSRMGEQGLGILVDETRSTDRFVRDISQYVLKRRIYAS